MSNTINGLTSTKPMRDAIHSVDMKLEKRIRKLMKKHHLSYQQALAKMEKSEQSH